MQAADPDDEKAALAFRMSAGNVDKTVSLNSSTGLLELIQAVPVNESSPVMRLSAQVSDGTHSSTVPITITFVPLENGGFHFSQTAYHFTVAENDKSARELAGLQLIGSFLNEEVSFHLLSEHSTFHLNPVTGSLRTTGVAPLDREETTNVTLYVEAVSLSRAGRRVARAEIVIVVADRNDNVPLFSLPVYRAVVAVATAPNTPLLYVSLPCQCVLEMYVGMLVELISWHDPAVYILTFITLAGERHGCGRGQ